ncbi:hypothetical protein [Ideonella sp. A 288]|uniref:hypothetical protein n=1 Tax=Ideonella sp. A 288 TaxID=1962181 RepID=UPI000B4B0D10|nr:hypothetical protein [Ideonella sp. A 288]
MTTASLLWGLLFGSLGAGYALYGKKQRALVPFVCGLALMGVPYLVDNALLLVAIGAALAAIPFVVRD